MSEPLIVVRATRKDGPAKELPQLGGDAIASAKRKLKEEQKRLEQFREECQPDPEKLRVRFVV